MEIPTQLFYEETGGDRLIDARRFPITIRRYLAGETRLLEAVTRPCKLLIEVGCMEGRHAEWALEHGMDYLGLDVVDRYINGASQRLRQQVELGRCSLQLASAEDLPAVLKANTSFVGAKHPLLFFPFNSFGNMQRVERVALSIAETGLPFMIGTYSTNRYATSCRMQYYQNCDYSGITSEESPRGISFTSEEGLQTFAYHSKFLRSLFPPHYVIRRKFSSIGVAYLQRGCA